MSSKNNEFSYPTEYDLVDFFTNTWKKMEEYSIEENKKINDPNYSYRQTWLMSKSAWDSLPENATWYDMIMAGTIFQG
jgi:hypothetical protein